MSKQEKTERMYALVEQWQQSGQSQSSFAESHQINIHTLRYWISKRFQSEQCSGFIQLSSNTGTNISLRYPNGVELLLPSTISVSTLKGLVNL